MYFIADIGDSLDRAWDEFFIWLPRLIGFLAIVVIGYIVAKLVEGIVTRLLQRGGFDRVLQRGTGGSYVMRIVRSPAGLLGTLTFWAVFLGALSIAVDVLGIAALEDLVHAVWAYIPNVLAALLIFIVASLIATALVELVDRTMGDTPTGGIVKTVAPVLVMAVAVFMILDQLQIANHIVVITYAGWRSLSGLAAATSRAGSSMRPTRRANARRTTWFAMSEPASSEGRRRHRKRRHGSSRRRDDP